MSIETIYVVSCDGVIGSHGDRSCPNQKTSQYLEKDVAINCAKSMGFVQPFKDKPEILVCSTCWMEYKRWGYTLPGEQDGAT